MIRSRLHLFPRLIRKQFYSALIPFILRLNKVRIGQNCRFYNYINIKIEENTSVYIGDNVVFCSSDGYNPIARNIEGSIVVENGASLYIGDNSGLSSVCIWATKSITVGDNVKIGADTIILDSDAHSLDFSLRRDPKEDALNRVSQAIKIEDDVLIGARCVVLKGVSIGARSIVGAGSVVTKDIPSDCIAAGNPCRVIKMK